MDIPASKPSTEKKLAYQSSIANFFDITPNANVVHKLGNPKNSCPFYKTVPGANFIIDGFKEIYEMPRCKSYFLSHFHSDHYHGLNHTFNRGTIYCSKITANLLICRLRVPKRYIKVLDYKTRTNIEGVDVTFYCANHCPGAVCILFEFPNGEKHLHTGDMRYDDAYSDHIELTKLRINNLYLDTTYCNEKGVFPSQKVVIDKSCEIAKQYNDGNTSFVVGSYTIGKERLYFKLSNALDMKIHVQKDKLDILSCLDLESKEFERLTTNAHETKLSVLPMPRMNSKSLIRLLKGKSGERIVAFIPTAMIYGKASDSLEDIYSLKLEPEVSECERIFIYRVPYSEHSSLSELKRLVQNMNPRFIIPTVNNLNKVTVKKMIDLIKP